MAEITKLKGIKASEAESLRTAGVTTVEELWLRISEEQDNGLAMISSTCALSKDRLMELLIAESLRPTGRYGSGWLKEHWPDLVVFIVLVLLGGLVWIRVR